MRLRGRSCHRAATKWFKKKARAGVIRGNMKSYTLVAVTVFSLGTIAAKADVIRLSDGTVLEGQIAEPVEVTVKTAEGDRKVAFALLPPELQKVYWSKAVAPKVASAPATPAVASVSDEELSALANEVNLDTWEQVASMSSFRDKPEKRGTGGLVVTKAFNALDENWVTVYSPKDPVGQAWNWSEQVERAKKLQARAPQFLQRRWLDLFIKAGEAVENRDSNEFAQCIRELKRTPITITAAQPGEASKNFFSAK